MTSVVSHPLIALGIFGTVFYPVMLAFGPVAGALAAWMAGTWFYLGRERRQLEERRGSNRVAPWVIDSQVVRDAGIPMLVTGALAAGIIAGAVP